MMQNKDSDMPPFNIGSLGEIAIRCVDINAMVAFYRDIIGLEIMSGAPDEGFVFFKITTGYSGHTTVLALFAFDTLDQHDVHPQSLTPPKSGAASTLHHFDCLLTKQNKTKPLHGSHLLSKPLRCFILNGFNGVVFF